MAVSMGLAVQRGGIPNCAHTGRDFQAGKGTDSRHFRSGAIMNAAGTGDKLLYINI
jgi:hypothetical protein